MKKAVVGLMINALINNVIIIFEALILDANNC